MADDFGDFDAPPPDDADNVTAIGSARRKRRKKTSPPPAGDWTDRLTRNDEGQVKSTLANGTLALTHDPAWQGVLGFDERAECAVMLQPPPFPDAPVNLLRAPRTLVDSDDVRTVQWLEENHGISISDSQAHRALNAVAESSPFDRVREYLEDLQWDGATRLSTWASMFLGAADSEYSRAVARRWMISAVARTFQPGCKADHVLVLEGPQGIGKSTALETLAGGREHFADDVPAIGSKDAQQYLGALWIVELGEMEAATKTESALLKRFLTTTTDRYRPPYGRRMVLHERRCVFVGTVNLDEYLKDPTGGRRFWPLRCGAIDVEGLAVARDQLWAEAVAVYRAGEPWHLDDPALVAAANQEQAERLEQDPWEDTIRDYLHGLPRDFVTTAEVLAGAIKLDAAHYDKRHANRVGTVMRALRWRKSEGRDANSERKKGWKRP